MYDINKVREDFPILSRTIHKKPLIYLDNGATTQKPNTVLEAMQRVYTEHNANVHRGVHTLSREATELHEASRRRVARFISKLSSHEEQLKVLTLLPHASESNFCLPETKSLLVLWSIMPTLFLGK